MKLTRTTSTVALLTIAVTPAIAQQAKAPEIRPIGNTVATTSDSIVMVSGVRHLPGGKVLLNDPMSRRLLLLDANLKVESVVADTTAATGNAYGSQIGNLVAYKGDSSLYVDASSLSMLVIDGNGKVARVMSIPRSQDARMLVAAQLGGMGFDGERMIYRGGGGGMQFRMAGGAASNGAAGGGMSASPLVVDTTPITRVNLATRAMDTVAFIKVNNPKTNMTRSEDGNMSLSIELNPLPVVDEYALLSDGRIAIIRGRDYHVDFIGADGKVTSAPKIPFEWKRMSDEDKTRLIDSVKAVTERAQAAGGSSAAARVGATLGAAMGGGGAPMVVTSVQTRSAAGGEPPMRGATQMRVSAPTVSYVSPSELPDYQPAFFGNAARGDMDGNLWVRIIPPKPVAGGAVYDVINGKGELIDRVQIPVNRTIAGFGPGGTVYMTSTENGRTIVERANYR